MALILLTFVAALDAFESLQTSKLEVTLQMENLTPGFFVQTHITLIVSAASM